MPVYEYECCDCSARFELREGFHDNGKHNCPKCSAETRRVFSPVPIIFKGSGFYVTDYGRPGGGGSTCGKTSNGESSSESETKKTDTPSNADSSNKD